MEIVRQKIIDIIDTYTYNSSYDISAVWKFLTKHIEDIHDADIYEYEIYEDNISFIIFIPDIWEERYTLQNKPLYMYSNTEDIDLYNLLIHIKNILKKQEYNNNEYFSIQWEQGYWT